MNIGNITSDNFNLNGVGKDIQIEVYEQLIRQLQQENKQLKSNWNKLKEWIKVRDNIVYDNGKVVSIKEKKKAKELVEEIAKFKEYYDIKTDDVITIIDMYFANYFNIEYIGKPLF